MQKPAITWLDSNLDVLSSVSFTYTDPETHEKKTTLKKGQTSDPTVVKIANNFTKSLAAGEAVYDAVDCTLSVKPAVEGVESVLVKEKWLSVSVAATAGDTAYTAIGGETDALVSVDVYAKDLESNKGISGAVNDGTANTANIATLNIKAEIPAETTAEGGRKDFVLVLAYSYGDQ